MGYRPRGSIIYGVEVPLSLGEDLEERGKDIQDILEKLGLEQVWAGDSRASLGLGHERSVVGILYEAEDYLFMSLDPDDLASHKNKSEYRYRGKFSQFWDEVKEVWKDQLELPKRELYVLVSYE